MKASELVKNLQSLIKQYGDLELCYAVDDEGNDFKPVYFDAEAGYFKDDEYTSCESPEYDSELEPNAICIN